MFFINNIYFDKYIYEKRNEYSHGSYRHGNNLLQGFPGLLENVFQGFSWAILAS